MMSRMVGSVLTLMTLLFSVGDAVAQTYTQMQWGMNKGVTPYAFGANINGAWTNLGTISSAGVWSIPSTNLSFTQTGTGAIAITVNAKLRTLPVRPEEFGAVADCSTDNTLAIQRAINAGNVIEFQNTAACYLTDRVVINSTTAKNIIIGPGVVIKRKTGTCGDAQIFNVFASPGTQFSGGGTIDGNRSAFTGCITPSFNPGWALDGIVVRSADVTIRDLSFVNVVRNGINAAFSDRLTLDNLRFSNSGTGIAAQYINNLNVSNIFQSQMGNNGFPIYQHINEIRGVTDGVINNFYLTSWAPDRIGLEPHPIGLSLQVTRANVSNVAISGFTGTGGEGTLDSRSEGIAVPTCIDSKFSNITSFGNALTNISVGGAIRCQFSKINLYDGTYTAKNFYLTSWGYENTDVTTSAYDALGVSASHDVTISDLVSSGGEYGLEIRSGENVAISNAILTNNKYGASVQCSGANFSVPSPVDQCPRQISFTGAKIATNSFCGLYADGFANISVDGASHIYNNGQLNTSGALFQGGACVGGVKTSTQFSVASGAFMGDTQTWTRSAAASFAPGSTDANNRYKVTLLDPQDIQPGQFIILQDAAGAGADIKVRVVAYNDDTGYKTVGGISSYGGNVDQITVQTASPTTFSTSAASTPLAGTLSSSGSVVTGVGTAFASAIKGHAWLCFGSNCARVARINSNTQLITETPFSPALSAATVSLITVNVQGVPSQSYAIAVQSGSAQGPISYGTVGTSGLTQAGYYFANVNLSKPNGVYNPVSFTPTDASGAGLTFTTATGIWTRDGSTITVNFNVVWPVTTDTSAARIGGLPFTSNTTAASQFGGSITYTDYGTPATLLVGTTTKRIELYKLTGAAVTNADLSGKIVRGTIRYMTLDPPL